MSPLPIILFENSTMTIEGALLTLSGSLIMILLGIIGYQLRISASSRRNNDNELSKAINNLNITMEGIKTSILEQRKFCDERHKPIDRFMDTFD